MPFAAVGTGTSSGIAMSDNMHRKSYANARTGPVDLATTMYEAHAYQAADGSTLKGVDVGGGGEAAHIPLEGGHRAPDGQIRIRLIGDEFFVRRTLLEKSGSLVLQGLVPDLEKCPHYLPDASRDNQQQTYYLPQRGTAFREILYYLEHGSLDMPKDLSISMWLHELFFYDIDSVSKRFDGLTRVFEEDNADDTTIPPKPERDGGAAEDDGAVGGATTAPTVPKVKLTFSEKYDAMKAWVWGITDGNLEVHESYDEYQPQSSSADTGPAKAPITRKVYALTYAYTYFSMAILLASVVLMCVETLPRFRLATVWQCSFSNGTLSDNAASICEGVAPASEDLQLDQYVGSGDGGSNACVCDTVEIDTRNDTIYVWEATFVTWFAFELLVRFFASPDRMKFSKGVLNLIDLLAILPFFVDLAAESGQIQGLELIRILRLVRVFRVVKLARHSSGLKIFGMALWMSGAIMTQLMVFLVTVSVLFSAMIFYAEYKNEDHEYGYFDSIPRSIWWAIVTMTTVGYGDLVPKTLVGQIIGSLCAMSGIFVIALPIPIFVENFQQLWLQMRNTTPTWQLQYNKIRDARISRRESVVKQIARKERRRSSGNLNGETTNKEDNSAVTAVTAERHPVASSSV